MQAILGIETIPVAYYKENDIVVKKEKMCNNKMGNINEIYIFFLHAHLIHSFKSLLLQDRLLKFSQLFIFIHHTF